MEVSKQDWKLFREKVGEWQERYMEELTHDYIRILNSSDAPSEKFWKLEKRIRNDKKSKGVHLELSKRNIFYDIAAFINDGIITYNDLSGFTDELKEIIKHIISVHY